MWDHLNIKEKHPTGISAVGKLVSRQGLREKKCVN
jgi:hypothetical protein